MQSLALLSSKLLNRYVFELSDRTNTLRWRFSERNASRLVFVIFSTHCSSQKKHPRVSKFGSTVIIIIISVGFVIRWNLLFGFHRPFHSLAVVMSQPSLVLFEMNFYLLVFCLVYKPGITIKIVWVRVVL